MCLPLALSDDTTVHVPLSLSDGNCLTGCAPRPDEVSRLWLRLRLG